MRASGTHEVKLARRFYHRDPPSRWPQITREDLVGAVRLCPAFLYTRVARGATSDEKSFVRGDEKRVGDEVA
ncbi:hypothetical protein Poly21_45720 [Allorhodopirellula heiligendammensis]|uniref:Uncharacterized protein n=1 Tax=Allorhodopirellula heiligendammensis TaxID=2714739 RepID=A0A5C6BH88_9BACT|nr:hypothetical protein Poly21_45720 [Allorhodopirellula heiligendammensis]